MQHSTPIRTYVLVALGWPVIGRRGYRGVGTVRCAARAEARAVAAAYERRYAWSGAGAGPVRPLRPAQAGTRLLLEALTADGAGRPA